MGAKSSQNYPLLLASQFLGAFGDNAILMVIVGQLTLMQVAGRITPDELRATSTIYTSLLFLPYVLLAPLAGYLNDRYPKTTWLRGGNLIKLLGTLICALSIKFGYAWQGIGYVIVGIGATFYGPAKYGILPEILPRERLVKANGMVELLTLVAILGGGIGGSVIIDKLSVSWCYVILVSIYGASFGLNLLMDATPFNPAVRLAPSVGEFFAHFGSILKAPRLGKVLIGTALFWICGATMKINFQAWGLAVLHLPNNTQIALLGLWLSVGLMAGSILAGQWHRVGDLVWTRRYGFALAAMLALIFTVEYFDFWRGPVVKFAEPGPLAGLQLIIPVVLLLIGTGLVAGLFLIPLNAALQAESDPRKLGKTIATQNFTDNCGMIFAGLYCLASVKAHLTASEVFLGLALILTSVVFWLRIPQKPSDAKE